ncbi:hypothetical protein HPY86_07040 [candidate division WOR-3 bacterium]|nr:hypothetical protein [candidate division WOR-3 bacterium]
MRNFKAALAIVVASSLLLPSVVIGYQCKYQSGTAVAFASCSNCNLPGANCPQGEQCPRRTYQRGKWWTLVDCQQGGGKSYSGNYHPSFQLLGLINEVKSNGSKEGNFTVNATEAPLVTAVTADPFGNMVNWFNFTSFAGQYALTYNESENTITFNIIAIELGPSMQWGTISTGPNTANWNINGTLNLADNTFVGKVSGNLSNLIYPEATPVEYELDLNGNVDFDSNTITFSGDGWVFYPFQP